MSPAIAWLARVVEELAKLRTFVAAVLVATLVYALVGPERAGPENTASPDTMLLVKPIAVVFGLWFTAYLVMYWIYYQTVDSFECRDVSANPRMPSARQLRRGQELGSIGFHYAGELEARFPWQRWRHVWLFVDSTGCVTSLIGARPWMSLWTGWPEGRLVVTAPGFPAMVRRTANSAIVAVSPRTPAADRYRRHVAEAQVFGGGRMPLQPRTVAEYLAINPLGLVPTREVLRAAFRPASLALYAFLYAMLTYAIAS